MKKFTLFAAFAALAVSAGAQETATPDVAGTVVEGQKAVYNLVVAADEVVTALEGAGQEVTDWRVNDETRFLYVWDNTFVGVNTGYPAVGYDGILVGEYEYPNLEVGTIGWSGAGWFISIDAKADASNWNENTRFHVATRTAGTAPTSLAFVIADGGNITGEGENGNTHDGSPAKVALGENFQDGNNVYPSVGPKVSDEWAGLDLSFAELKKFYPSFDWKNANPWEGNVVSVLGGGVQGQSFSIDNMFFYTPAEMEDNAVGKVADDAQFIVTRNTINVANGNGIALYDLSGRMIKSATGTVLGISELGNGIYVAKSGNSIVKIMK